MNMIIEQGCIKWIKKTFIMLQNIYMHAVLLRGFMYQKILKNHGFHKNVKQHICYQTLIIIIKKVSTKSAYFWRIIWWVIMLKIQLYHHGN